MSVFFFFQAEDGIRDLTVTGVQTCALPICARPRDGAIRRGPAGQGPGEAVRFGPNRTAIEPTARGVAEGMNRGASSQAKRRKGELRLPAEEGSPLNFAGYHGRNVMVTGGAGFVGSALVRQLLDTGANVTVYDNFLHGSRANLDDLKGKIAVIPGDVLDEWKLLDAATGANVEYLFHCVGDTYVPTAYDVPKRFFRINVEGTMNVLLLAKRTGMKRVLYVSST